ncbi:xanthine dehydrogenase family protein molybdopterin-binding subunit [soil metagenome]
MKQVGARTRRIEDAALVRGAGHYLDDVKVHGTLHAAFVRSTVAHARIRGVDMNAARSMNGVAACLSAADMAPLLADMRLPIAFPEGQMAREAMPFVLVQDETCHVGETIAIVVAESRALAEDAAARVVVDYEPLQPLIDCRDALRDDSPLPCVTDAIKFFKRFKTGWGDCRAAFAKAHVVVALDLSQERGVAHPIEGRGILAYPDPATRVLTVWASTQMAHELSHTICALLRLPEPKVRVITPDVGGGFGAKYLVYPEDIAVAAAAQQLGRPVKWVEDRREHFLSAIQERVQHWHVEAAVDSEGRLLAVRGSMVHDQGAFAPHSVNVPFNSATSMPGPYVLPAYELEVDVVRTNKVPVIPIRGAGYPQGCFAMERLMDRIASELGIDRGEVRLRNYITPEQMPDKTQLLNRAGGPIVYDSGDYPTSHRVTLDAAAVPGFRLRQAEARAEGRYIGIGYAHAVKGTGRGPFESGTVRVGCDGRVNVATGAAPMGQGLATALAQIAADGLGVDIAAIDVTCGDTYFTSLGMGGYASRQTVTAGSSVHLAAEAVRRKALALAALVLEVPVDKVEMRSGEIYLVGADKPSLQLGDMASRLRGLPGYAFPEGFEPGLEATFHFRVDQLAYANAFHVCEVEVDIETGLVTVDSYLAMQDSGVLINPRLVEGQIHGSVVHGIGNTLFEQMRYDEAGNPLTTTFSHYLMPTAGEVPQISVLLRETPSPLNPLGVKGAGECSVLPVASSIVSAIEDALAEYDIQIAAIPLSPMDLVELLRKGR